MIFYGHKLMKTTKPIQEESGKMLRKSAEMYAMLTSNVSQHYLKFSTPGKDLREFAGVPVSYFQNQL